LASHVESDQEDRVRTSEQTGELYAAIIALHSRLENPKASKTADTGKFRYSYAPLDEIVAEVRTRLNEFGLAAVQETVAEGEHVGVTTRIIHSSGEWLECGPLWLRAGETPQESGSALTYCRRYSLVSALLLAAEEDDDGAAATRGAASKQTASSASVRKESVGTGPAATGSGGEGLQGKGSSPSGTKRVFPKDTKTCPHRAALIDYEGERVCSGCGLPDALIGAG
jgi:hypothetical protein